VPLLLPSLLCDQDVADEMPTFNVSYKPQKISPKYEGSVRQLLHKKIRDSYLHPQVCWLGVIHSYCMHSISPHALMLQPVFISKWLAFGCLCSQYVSAFGQGDTARFATTTPVPPTTCLTAAPLLPACLLFPCLCSVCV
jgi:hypothetical protein